MWKERESHLIHQPLNKVLFSMGRSVGWSSDISRLPNQQVQVVYVKRFSVYTMISSFCSLLVCRQIAFYTGATGMYNALLLTVKHITHSFSWFL